MHAFIEKQERINTQLAQTMKDLKDTLAKFTSALSFQVRVALEANTWIKSNQPLLFAVVRLLKNLFLNLDQTKESQSQF